MTGFSVPGFPKAARQPNNFRSTNKYYRFFDYVGKRLAEVNAQDKKEGKTRSNIQRFSY